MKQDKPAAPSRTKRLSRVAALVVLATGLLGVASWLISPRAMSVMLPSRGHAVQAVYATGTVEASVTIRVAPQVAGRIVELDADEGQSVALGRILARLDDSDLRAALAELDARARYAEQQFERSAALVKQGWATREKFDQARSDMEAARHAAQRVSEQMGFMTLKAPADGLIIRRDGEVGEFVPVNQPVFYLAKAGAPLRISAEVDEEDIPLVKAGQKVVLKADAFPNRIIDAEVSDITPKGDPVARSYRVRIALPVATPLQIGMTAETNIITREKTDALLIPMTALSGAAVWIVRDGRLVRRAVVTGIRGPDRVEIVEGLADRDLIVVSPSDDLKEGERVRVTSARNSAAANGERAQ